MLRRMFTLASVASIGLALAGTAVWARSFWVGDGWYVLWERPPAAVGTGGSTGGREAVEVSAWSSRGTLEAIVQEGTSTAIDLPDWAIALAGLILPGFWLIRRVRRRRVGGFEVVGKGEAEGEKKVAGTSF